VYLLISSHSGLPETSYITLKAMLKSNGERASPCFKLFLMENIKQILPYPDSTARFNETHFY
jgi:hypothetical protein